MQAWDIRRISRFLILAVGYDQPDRCGSFQSRVSHWEQIPVWLHRDFMLATCVNLPGVEATPRSRGLSLVGKGCLLTVHTWIVLHTGGLMGVGSHSATFFGGEFTTLGFWIRIKICFIFLNMHKRQKNTSFICHLLRVCFAFFTQPVCSFMVAVAAQNYLLALHNTNKQRQQRRVGCCVPENLFWECSALFGMFIKQHAFM